MKRLILSTLVLTGLCAVLPALDISTRMGWDNACFDTDRATPLGPTTDRFEPQGALFWSMDLREKVGENVWIRLGYDRGALLRDRVKTAFGVEYDIFSVFAGPFFSPFINREKVLGSGLSTELSLRIPGVVFVKLQNDTSLGSGLTMTGDFFQSNSILEAGFWVPNVIISGRITLEDFIEKESGTLIINDRKIRYDFVTGFFKKNVPYRIEIRLGYQGISRALNDNGVETVDTLHTLITGLDISAIVHPKVRVFAGGEFYLAPWTSGGMLPPAADAPLFQASGGVQLTLPSVIATRKSQAE